MIALNLKHRVEPSSISNDSNDRDIQVHVNIYIHFIHYLVSYESTENSKSNFTQKVFGIYSSRIVIVQ